MNAPAKLAEVTPQTVAFKLDGKTVHAYEGETIFKAAARHGVDIPHLCYKDGLRPDGNCRACVVEVKGERTLAPSCCRSATAGMEVQAVLLPQRHRRHGGAGAERARTQEPEDGAGDAAVGYAGCGLQVE